MGIGGVGFICEADVGVEMQIYEDPFGGFEEGRGGFVEGAGEHAGGVGDVGARLSRGVEDGADELLVPLANDRVGVVGVEQLGVGD